MRDKYGSNNIELIYTAEESISATEDFQILSDENDNGRHTAVLSLPKDGDTNAVLGYLIGKGVKVTSFKELLPRMNDIFIKLVTE